MVVAVPANGTRAGASRGRRAGQLACRLKLVPARFGKSLRALKGGLKGETKGQPLQEGLKREGGGVEGFKGT